MKKITSKNYFALIISFFTFQALNAQNFDWARIMGDTTEDFGYSIAVDAAGNSYTTGYFQGKVDFDPGANTTELTSAGGKDIFITKLDPSGNLLWAKQMGGTGDDIGTAIALSKSGYLYIMGSFNGTADLDPSAASLPFTSGGLRDIAISKLNTSGNLIWSKSIGGIGDDPGTHPGD
jgi:hypothetical protein